MERAQERGEDDECRRGGNSLSAKTATRAVLQLSARLESDVALSPPHTPAGGEGGVALLEDVALAKKRTRKEGKGEK